MQTNFFIENKFDSLKTTTAYLPALKYFKKGSMAKSILKKIKAEKRRAAKAEILWLVYDDIQNYERV